MNIAFCYESVLPVRGGCETYIAALARRLVSDGHELHLYASRWDAEALPPTMHFHRLPQPRGPRFLRPWRFGAACERALRQAHHHVTVGFDKTWGQDVLYLQGGLQAASAEHNLRKHRNPFARTLARVAKALDLAHWSYLALERRQFLVAKRPLVVAISHMVRRHFRKHYAIPANELRVVHCGIDPNGFAEPDRLRSRYEWRSRCGIAADETVALFVAMNYRLKGLEPLLHAVRRMPDDTPFRLLVVGNPSTHRYERLAQKLGIRHRVCFVGPQRDVQHCYFAADFMVHPTFYDPCSLVVLEALSCGLPVITSRFNGASELLRPPHDSYVISDPHDHAHLVWCMTQMLDRGRRIACTQAVRRAAGRWTWEHHYHRILQVLREAAARKQAA
jgi:UDP-glucose:(heptosyl)LPS alpha-1,3-glucosyltransferase